MSAKRASGEIAVGEEVRDAGQKSALQHIAAALRGLQFGVVSVIVQDGVVIQIERTEKTRLRGKQQT